MLGQVSVQINNHSGNHIGTIILITFSHSAWLWKSSILGINPSILDDGVRASCMADWASLWRSKVR